MCNDSWKEAFETRQFLRNLGCLGYQRMWLQCRVKVKNLIATYRKIDITIAEVNKGGLILFL